MAKLKTLLRAVGFISILPVILSLIIIAPSNSSANPEDQGAALSEQQAVQVEQQAAPDKININTATEQELPQLKRLTPDLAKRIIDYRQKKGPFKKAEDIRKVKGIGLKFWQANKDRITVEEEATEKKEETGVQTPEESRPTPPPQEVTPPKSPEPSPEAKGTAAQAVEGSSFPATEEKAPAAATEEKEAAPSDQEAAPSPEGEKAVPPQEAK